jgi:hypothetical protein
MQKVTNLKRNTLLCTLLACLCLFVVGLAFAAALQARQDAADKRVLFIGNSYTYFNDLPAIFSTLAEAGHQGKVDTLMIAPGGKQLRDHWEKGEALKALQQGKWDYVVLQDQSLLGTSYYVEGHPRVVTDQFFKPYAEKWAAAIRNAGAVPVFYLTWARKDSPEDQAELNYAYFHAAQESKSLVAPAGIAWDLVRKRQPSIELFYKDGSHPSPAGSYLTACAFYASVFDKNPAGLPSRISGVPVNLETEQLEPDKTAVLVDLPEAQAQVLQSAAWDAWQLLKQHGGYLDASPASPPVIAPLPLGRPLSAAGLEGTWTGTVLFFPTGPVEMTLLLHLDGAAWKGQLQLKYHYPDIPDESIDLTDLQVGAREFSFHDPKSMGNFKVDVLFQGIEAADDEMRGTADSTRPEADTLFHWLGTWQLHKQPVPAPALRH